MKPPHPPAPPPGPAEAYLALCDRHGADLARWPEAARTEGERLRALDPAGVAKAAAAALALASLLGLDEVAEPSAALEARILNSLPRPLAPRRQPLWQRLVAPLSLAAAGAVSFAASLVLMPVDFGTAPATSDAAVEAVLAYTLEDPSAVEVWDAEPEAQL